MDFQFIALTFRNILFIVIHPILVHYLTSKKTWAKCTLSFFLYSQKREREREREKKAYQREGRKWRMPRVACLFSVSPAVSIYMQSWAFFSSFFSDFSFFFSFFFPLHYELFRVQLNDQDKSRSDGSFLFFSFLSFYFIYFFFPFFRLEYSTIRFSDFWS